MESNRARTRIELAVGVQCALSLAKVHAVQLELREPGMSMSRDQGQEQSLHLDARATIEQEAHASSPGSGSRYWIPDNTFSSRATARRRASGDIVLILRSFHRTAGSSSIPGSPRNSQRGSPRFIESGNAFSDSPSLARSSAIRRSRVSCNCSRLISRLVMLTNWFRYSAAMSLRTGSILPAPRGAASSALVR